MGNRSYEIEQTTLFEKKYVKAKEYALKTGKCFICATHYPVKDCLDKFDREAIYFSGHTHQNNVFVVVIKWFMQIIRLDIIIKVILMV